MSASALVLLAGVAALGALVQAVSGFGGGLVLAPVLFAVLEPAEAVLSLVVLGIAQTAVMVVAGRRHVLVAELRALLVAAVPGLAVGVLVLRAAPGEVLRVAVGVSVLAATAVRTIVAHEPPRRRAAVPVGFLAAALTTSVAINGPPLVLYLTARRVTPAQARATLAATFLALDGASVAALAVGGTLAAPPTAAAVTLAVAFPAGLAVGLRLAERVDANAYRRATTLLLLVLGVVAIAAGLR